MKMMDNDMHDVEPVHIFLQDSGGTVKSYLTKVIYNVTSKALLYLCKDHDKPQVTLHKKKKKRSQMSLLRKIKQYVNGMIKHTEVNKMHTQHKWKQWNSATLIIMPK